MEGSSGEIDIHKEITSLTKFDQTRKWSTSPIKSSHWGHSNSQGHRSKVSQNAHPQFKTFKFQSSGTL